MGDGEGQTVGNGTDMVAFVEAEGTALPGFQIFVDHLIAANVEVPYFRWHGGKVAGLVDVDGLLLRGIAHRLDHMLTLAVINSQLAPFLLAQQMGVHQTVAELRELIKLRFGVNEGNPREVNAQKFGIALAVGWGGYNTGAAINRNLLGGESD